MSGFLKAGHSVLRQFALAVLRQFGLVLVTIASLQIGVGTVHAQKDISAELARAESLYYDAHFQSSLALLLDLDSRISNDPQSDRDRLRIELYLGLVHIALNQMEQAKSRFVELCTLNRDYALDPREFPPKVMALFDEARTECGKKPPSAKTRTAIDEGQQLYLDGRYAEALKQFTAILALDSSNELATEYLKLTRQQLELRARVDFSDWSKSFDRRQFANAADAYNRIRSSPLEPLATELASEAESRYRSVLGDLKASWKTSCEAGDPVNMDLIRKEAVTVSSGLLLGHEALSEMQQCVPVTCLQGNPELALHRLKTGVRLEIEQGLQQYITRRIRIGVEIDKGGKTTVKQVTNANSRLSEALKTAVERWEFYPALVDNVPRCVETEFPISLIAP